MRVPQLYGIAEICDQSGTVQGLFQVCKKLSGRCNQRQIKEPYVIDTEKCIKCGACESACAFGAIHVEG